MTCSWSRAVGPLSNPRVRSVAASRRSHDPAYADAVAHALEYAVDLAEAELRRRGIEGTLRPLTHQGKLTGDHIREYSDACLIFYLKGRRRDVFADRILGGSPNGEHVIRLEDLLERASQIVEGQVVERPALSPGKPDPFSRD